MYDFMNDSINYYELLGVKNDATKEEIRKAYRTMAKKWHPDINKDESASTMIVMLNEAKETLLDDIKRRDYDNYLKNRTNPAYDNIKRKAESKTSSSYKQTTNQTYSEDKTYTKWQYFREYIKYYNAPVWIKILATVGVLLETIICGTLQIANFVVAYLFCVAFELLNYFLNVIIGLFSMLLILCIFMWQTGQDTPFTMRDGIVLFCFLIFLILLVFLPQYVIRFLTQNMPYYLSKLNIFLFKKCVGYKD